VPVGGSGFLGCCVCMVDVVCDGCCGGGGGGDDGGFET